VAEVIRVQLPEAKQGAAGEVSSLAPFGTGMGSSDGLGCGETESGRIPESATSVDILFPMEVSTGPKVSKFGTKVRAFLIKPLALSRFCERSRLSGQVYGENRVSAGSVDVSARILSTCTERPSERPVERVHMERIENRSQKASLSGIASL